MAKRRTVQHPWNRFMTAVLMRAGALPAPLKVIEERSIGASLGADAIQAGLYSIPAGFTLVVAIMAGSAFTRPSR